MKRFQGLLTRSKSVSLSQRNIDDSTIPVDSPEASAPRAIRLFCESGSASNGGEEVLHLPVIVEAAESSPGAAASAAQQIRKFLSKDWQQKPYVQYNAIMLIRILSDNPGASFTRNFDKNFVAAVKDTLRTCKDPSTQQILRETLDALEAEKSHDDGIANLLQMWRKEKGYQASISQARRPPMMPNQQWPQQQQGFGQGQAQQQRSHRGSSKTQLPSPGELASRVEEARNTAKILLQLIQSTPSDEVLNNELIREFGERCQTASRSMQTYVNCDNPAPDHDTMQTLIETNEQLSLATSRHQRALLAARRALGTSPSPNAEAMYGVSGGNGNGNGNGNSSSLTSSFSALGFQTAGYGHASSPPQDSRGVSPPQSFRTVSPAEVSRNASPPQIPTTRINGFEGHGSYTPPPDRGNYQSLNPTGYPQQQQQQQQGEPTSLFAAVDQPSNPFADPLDHRDAPAQSFGMGHFRNLAPRNSPPAPRIPEPSQSFSIEPEPTFATPSIPPLGRHHTAELENAYSPDLAASRRTPQSSGHPSPVLTRASATTSSPRPDSASGYTVSPQASPHRPAAAAAQPVRSSAIYPHDTAVEIDGHSQVGRRDRDRDRVGRSDTISSFGSPDPGAGTLDSSASLYVVSPIDAARGNVSGVAPPVAAAGQQQTSSSSSSSSPPQPQHGFGASVNPRVDIAGTGGLRGFGS